ncbi:unnamed protein product [Clavelina lepadiformis]|uniref:Uncharacterized protein n=1 Tax=Clavelina lepadiformis TaxID=159417 RepID=A0ABP0F2V8_CLALP
MSHLQPIQHSLDPANEHFHLNDGDEELPGLQPPLEATMTDEQSTPVKTLCRLTRNALSAKFKTTRAVTDKIRVEKGLHRGIVDSARRPVPLVASLPVLLPPHGGLESVPDEVEDSAAEGSSTDPSNSAESEYEPEKS